MIIRRHPASLLTLLSCVWLLAGCDDAPPEPAAAPAASKSPAGPKPPGLPADMVAAVSAGKTATSLGVHFALRGPPTVGVPLSIDISVVPHREFEVVSAKFLPNDGLTLTSGGTMDPKSDPAVESVIKHNLVVLPEREGLFMVTVVVESEGDEGNVTRVFSIPVIVSASPDAAPPVPTPPPPAPATG
jgi:hypothetical protein